MAISSFLIVSVPVADQERAKRFYRDVVGFELHREESMGPGKSWIELGPKGGATRITLVTWFESMRPGGLQGVVLGVDDLQRDHAELLARGLQLSPIRSEAWGRYATFEDPDGNGWVLCQARPAP